LYVQLRTPSRRRGEEEERGDEERGERREERGERREERGEETPRLNQCHARKDLTHNVGERERDSFIDQERPKAGTATWHPIPASPSWEVSHTHYTLSRMHASPLGMWPRRLTYAPTI
jgi:hypothetical protein